MHEHEALGAAPRALDERRQPSALVLDLALEVGLVPVAALPALRPRGRGERGGSPSPSTKESYHGAPLDAHRGVSVAYPSRRRGRTKRTSMKQLMVLALLAAGCTDARDPSATTVDDLSTENGISFNGKSLNGMSFNGMSFNGLDLGLGTTSFASWFNADSARNTIEMQYVVKCAKSSGTTVTWTNPQTGATYSWPGLLGLAPTWTNRAMTTTEQQLITACLLAHGNKYGVHVAIAVEGKTASGSVLPQGTGELTTFSVKEAAFFGNTVTGDGMFVCLDHATWDASRSSARACGYDTHASGASTACPPMYQVRSEEHT